MWGEGNSQFNGLLSWIFLAWNQPTLLHCSLMHGVKDGFLLV